MLVPFPQLPRKLQLGYLHSLHRLEKKGKYQNQTGRYRDIYQIRNDSTDQGFQDSRN